MKLQNNYTTQEQSQRLLELGLPADSADCYFFLENSNIPLIHTGNGAPLFPCWSVGRLMEIIRECATNWVFRNTVIETLMTPTTDNVDVLVRLMTADECKSDLDFSKLED